MFWVSTYTLILGRWVGHSEVQLCATAEQSAFERNLRNPCFWYCARG
jgi:hypothetical protein